MFRNLTKISVCYELLNIYYIFYYICRCSPFSYVWFTRGFRMKIDTTQLMFILIQFDANTRQREHIKGGSRAALILYLLASCTYLEKRERHTRIKVVYLMSALLLCF